MLGFGKDKLEKRPVWQWGEDRTIRRALMEVESGAVEDNKNSRAFHSIQDFMMRDHIKGGLTLLVWQRDAFPKNPFRTLDTAQKAQLEDINKIADEMGRKAKDKALDDRRRSQQMLMFNILGYVFGITILLVLAFLIWQNGGISFGGEV